MHPITSTTSLLFPHVLAAARADIETGNGSITKMVGPVLEQRLASCMRVSAGRHTSGR